MADVLEAHLDALDLTDARSRLEHEAYSRLIEDHRGAGVRLMGLGDRMAGHRELPMGRHIAEAMAAPKVREPFQRFVGLEAELLELLQRRLAQDRQMLAAMGAED